MALQENLIAFRKSKDLSVNSLAQSSGVSVAYIHQIENGTKQNPTGAVLQKLALALGVSVADLLGAPTKGLKEALEEAPPSLKSWAKRRGKAMGLKPEDIEALKTIVFRGRRPHKEEDWELIFLILKKILG